MSGEFAFTGIIKPPPTLSDFNKQWSSKTPGDDSWMDEDIMTRGLSSINNDDPNSIYNQDFFGSVKPSVYFGADGQILSATDTSGAVNTSNAAGTKAYSAGLSQYAAIVSQMAAKYGVPENLIYAVMNTESGGNPNAVSSAGAQGLMQLMPATAKTMGVTNAFDPAQNIEGGVKYLAQMLQRYNGDQKLALQAYNAGPGAVDKFLKGQGTLPAETLAYVPKVNSYA